LERALAAMLQETTSGTRPRPNSGAARNDKAERAESGSAEREHVSENEHECPESENELVTSYFTSEIEDLVSTS
jgi:hypothetical protein